MLTHWERFKNNLLKYIMAAVLICVPLYPKFPFINIPGTYVAIRLEDFVVLLLAIALALSVNFNPKKFFAGPMQKAVILFLIINLFSVISGIFLTQTVRLNIGILHWGRRVEYMIGFFAGIQALRDRSNLSFYIKCLLLVVLFASVYGLGQKYLSWPVITTQNTEYSKGVALRYMPGGHLVSTFAGHYDLATFLILVIPTFCGILMLPKARAELELKLPKSIEVFFFLLTLGAGLWLLTNAASRISIVSYALAVGTALLLLRKYKAIIIFLIITFVVASFSSNLTMRYGQIFEVLIKKITKTSYIVNPVKQVYAQGSESGFRISSATPTPAPVVVFEDRSTSIRLNVEWPRAIRAFTKNPFLGTGLSSITLATDNDYLRLSGEVGLLGFLGFWLIFANLAILILKNFRSIKEADLTSAFFVGILGALPGVFLNGVFIDVFESSKFAIIFWIMLGFFVGTLNKKV